MISEVGKGFVVDFPYKNDRVTSLAIAPDGTVMLLGDSDGLVQLWSMEERRMVRSFEGHRGTINCLTFSADGKLAVSGGKDGTVRV